MSLGWRNHWPLGKVGIVKCHRTQDAFLMYLGAVTIAALLLWRGNRLAVSQSVALDKWIKSPKGLLEGLPRDSSCLLGRSAMYCCTGYALHNSRAHNFRGLHCEIASLGVMKSFLGNPVAGWAILPRVPRVSQKWITETEPHSVHIDNLENPCIDSQITGTANFLVSGSVGKGTIPFILDSLVNKAAV